MTAHTVLIIEDEKDIRSLLAYHLKKEGYTVLEAAEGPRGLQLAREELPDAILLDIMLPGLDGLSLNMALQREERTAAIPVLMLTAKGEEVDRIVGLEMGAADYIVKPFSVREVILRLRTALKRATARPQNPVLSCGGIYMDLLLHSVRADGRTIELTLTEFRLLEDLLRHKEKVRSREQLLDSAWGYAFEGYGRTVDTHIGRLRGKLGDCAGCLETVRGVGYRAREQEDAAGAAYGEVPRFTAEDEKP